MGKKRILTALLIIWLPIMLSAQYTYGTTGLLNAPNALMQKDKTVMLGFNFLNQNLTPPTWYYHTYNYYLNVTILPFFEVAYTCTLFKAEALGLKPYGYSGFTNQDRYFSLKLRILKEGQFWKYMPAVAVGTSDPFTSSGSTIASQKGNGYFNRFFIATTKHINIGGQDLAVSLSYLYNRRIEYKLNGLAAGVSYCPSFAPDLNIIAEYDSKNFSMGATYLFFKHIQAHFVMQKMKYFTGGMVVKFCLK